MPLFIGQQYQPRDVAISVADFGSAATLCHHTELLFTSSKKWAEVASQAKGLVIKPMPFDYGQVVYSMVYNKLSINDQAVSWLCDRIKEK